MATGITSNLVGYKIQILTEDGKYQGLLKRVVGNCEQLILDKVIICEEHQNKPLIGIQIFFGIEILSWEIVDNCTATNPNPTTCVIKKKLPPIPFGQQVKVTSDSISDDEESELEDDCTSDGILFSKEGTINWRAINGCDGPQNANFCLPTEYKIIDEIDSDFTNAIKVLNNEKIVGVSLFGYDIGRFGQLHWLNISSAKVVFLFDIYTLEGVAFDEGLRSLLENKDVLKVFHDARYSSDQLFHCFSVDLKNVIDTLAADVIYHLRQKKFKELPEKTRTQGQCVQQHLKDSTLMHIRNIGDDNLEIRPLPELLRIFLIRNVSYLCPLWLAISTKLQQDLMQAVDIFIKVVRDASSEDLALKLINKNILPPEMNCLVSKEAKYLHNIQRLQDNFEKESVLKTATVREKPVRRSLPSEQTTRTTLNEVKLPAAESEPRKISVTNGATSSTNSSLWLKNTGDSKQQATFVECSIPNYSSSTKHLLKSFIPAGMENNCKYYFK